MSFLLLAKRWAGSAAATAAAGEVLRTVDERIPSHRLEHRNQLGDDRLDERPSHRRAPDALLMRPVCSLLRHGEHVPPGRLQRGCSVVSARFQRTRRCITTTGCGSKGHHTTTSWREAMQSRKSILVVPLLMGAIAAPAVATAMPEGNGGYPFTPSYTVAQARQIDMHASTVHKPASPKQDLRSEAAADSSRTPATAVSHTVYNGRDLRTEAATDGTRAPASPPG